MLRFAALQTIGRRSLADGFGALVDLKLCPWYHSTQLRGRLRKKEAYCSLLGVMSTVSWGYSA
jgi:hypothetical protein